MSVREMPKRAKRKRGSEKWREMKREREAERERVSECSTEY